jgi:hypothetical protein
MTTVAEATDEQILDWATRTAAAFYAELAQEAGICGISPVELLAEIELRRAAQKIAYRSHLSR